MNKDWIKISQKDANNYLIIIVPAELTPCPNVGGGEKGNPRKSEVVSVNKHILDKNIWIAAVVEIATNVTNGFCIHDVDIFTSAILSPGGDEPEWKN